MEKLNDKDKNVEISTNGVKDINQNNWNLERLNDSLGHRCSVCKIWVYDDVPKKCKCQ